MKKIFYLSWFLLYVLNAFTGYFVHHVLLGDKYKAIANALHADVKSRLWAFILISIFGSFFCTFFFSKLKRYHSVNGGVLFGFLVGIWLTTGEYLSAYASSNAISLSLAVEWIILGIIQYMIAGLVLGLLFSRQKESV
ncbi:MAG: hypothetical protein ACHQHN_08775 [Sphingobacteriales bacterium]